MKTSGFITFHQRELLMLISHQPHSSVCIHAHYAIQQFFFFLLPLACRCVTEVHLCFSRTDLAVGKPPVCDVRVLCNWWNASISIMVFSIELVSLCGELVYCNKVIGSCNTEYFDIIFAFTNSSLVIEGSTLFREHCVLLHPYLGGVLDMIGSSA